MKIKTHLAIVLGIMCISLLAHLVIQSTILPRLDLCEKRGINSRKYELSETSDMAVQTKEATTRVSDLRQVYIYHDLTDYTAQIVHKDDVDRYVKGIILSGQPEHPAKRIKEISVCRPKIQVRSDQVNFLTFQNCQWAWQMPDEK